MVNMSNVTLVRRCQEQRAGAEPPRDGEEPCVNCYCRPMWCVDCLGKW